MTTNAFRSIAPGTELAILRSHEGGGMTFLLRMVKGARAPLHDHPGGEETYMISGRLRVSRRTSASKEALPDVQLTPGDYLYAPPHEVHDGYAEEDSLFFVVAPGGVARTP